MARIKIEDLPEGQELSLKELRQVLGGGVRGLVVMSAGQLAAPYIPGGTVLSAAMSGFGQLKNSLGG